VMFALLLVVIVAGDRRFAQLEAKQVWYVHSCVT
jgi:hypothetical protein